MYEFLYTAQTTRTREWVEGRLTVLGDRHYIMPNEKHLTAGDVLYPVDPRTIHAGTGKKDRNGDQIYEESVCRFYDDEGGTSYYLIKWDGGRAGYVCVHIESGCKDDLDDSFCGSCEIVGMTIQAKNASETRKNESADCADYIDRSALGIGMADRNAFVDPAYADGWNAAIAILQQAPTVDAEKIRHGHWEPNYEMLSNKFETVPIATSFTCSVCGVTSSCEYDYCHCGAKMDEEKEVKGDV